MVKATLRRIEKSDDGTFGVLSMDGKAYCVTLEPPDLGNQSDISCIPEGTYQCKFINSPHFGGVYELANVPGRSHILIHPGNTTRDTHGCVLLGRRFGTLNTARAILTSSKTCSELIDLTDGANFELRIVDVSEV